MFDYDLDAIVQQLLCQKRSLTRILNKHFQEGEDYIHESRGVSTGGRPLEIYLLNEPCRLQLLAMYALNCRSKVETTYLSIDYIKRYAPKETETLDFICTAVSSVYTCARQQWFLNNKYRVDLYFPDQRIVVECDEHDHEYRDEEYEKLREAELKKELDCKFIRYNPDAPDFCLAVLMSRILKALHGSS